MADYGLSLQIGANIRRRLFPATTNFSHSNLQTWEKKWKEPSLCCLRNLLARLSKHSRRKNSWEGIRQHGLTGADMAGEADVFWLTTAMCSKVAKVEMMSRSPSETMEGMSRKRWPPTWGQPSTSSTMIPSWMESKAFKFWRQHSSRGAHPKKKKLNWVNNPEYQSIISKFQS